MTFLMANFLAVFFLLTIFLTIFWILFKAVLTLASFNDLVHRLKLHNRFFFIQCSASTIRPVPWKSWLVPRSHYTPIMRAQKMMVGWSSSSYRDVGRGLEGPCPLFFFKYRKNRSRNSQLTNVVPPSQFLLLPTFLS